LSRGINVRKRRGQIQGIFWFVEEFLGWFLWERRGLLQRFPDIYVLHHKSLWDAALKRMLSAASNCSPTPGIDYFA
jgi:hypothetical protein